MHQNVFGGEAQPGLRLTGEVYSAPQTHSWIKGVKLSGREGKSE